jgi:hypothetical protein
LEQPYRAACGLIEIRKGRDPAFLLNRRTIATFACPMIDNLIKSGEGVVSVWRVAHWHSLSIGTLLVLLRID